MKPTRVMITSGGGPGVWGLLYALRHMPQRDSSLIVSDPDKHATLGTDFADECVRLPFAREPEYVDRLLGFCQTKRVDVLIPVYDGELSDVANRRADFESVGTAVLLPPADIVHTCVDKWRTYERLSNTDFLPSHALVRTVEETRHAIAGLGYPGRRVCARPTDGTGGRGLHIIDAGSGRFLARMCAKPGAARCTAEEFLKIRGDGPDEFPLIVAEYLECEELGVDLLARGGQVLEMVVRRKCGAMLHGNPCRIVFEEQAGERDWVTQLTDEMNLSGLFAIDARYDHAGHLRLLEINARPGAYIGASCARVHLLAWAIDMLLDDEDIDPTRYESDRKIHTALRVFADVTEGSLEPRVLPIRATAKEFRRHARPVPCRTPG